jgi:hypothetical protein
LPVKHQKASPRAGFLMFNGDYFNEQVVLIEHRFDSSILGASGSQGMVPDCLSNTWNIRGKRPANFYEIFFISMLTGFSPSNIT